MVFCVSDVRRRKSDPDPPDKYPKLGGSVFWVFWVVDVPP